MVDLDPPQDVGVKVPSKGDQVGFIASTFILILMHVKVHRRVSNRKLVRGVLVLIEIYGTIVDGLFNLFDL